MFMSPVENSWCVEGVSNELNIFSDIRAASHTGTDKKEYAIWQRKIVVDLAIIIMLESKEFFPEMNKLQACN